MYSNKYAFYYKNLVIINNISVYNSNIFFQWDNDYKIYMKDNYVSAERIYMKDTIGNPILFIYMQNVLKLIKFM